MLIHSVVLTTQGKPESIYILMLLDPNFNKLWSRDAKSCILPSHIIWLPSSNLQTKGFYIPAKGCVRKSFLINFWLLS